MHFNKILQHTIGWKLLNTALLFVINLLMVRLLGAAASGHFFYEITVLLFLLVMVSWSFESGMSYYASKNNGHIGTILMVMLPLLVIQLLVCWWLLSLIKLGINIYFSLLFIMGNLICNNLSVLFAAKKMFIKLNVIGCVVNFFTAVFLFIWWRINYSNQHLIVLLYLGSIAVQALLLVVFIVRQIKCSQAPVRLMPSLARGMFAYSTIAYISNVIFFLVTRLDYFFVEKYCSNLALSNYVQVSKLGQLLILIPSIIASVILPFTLGKENAISLSKVQQLCKGITLIFLPITVVIVASFYWLLPWLFGKEFNLMYATLLIYLPGFFFLSITSVLAAYLAAKNFVKINLIASVIALFIVGAGNTLLIPIWGIHAAALVSSIAYASCTIFIVRFYKKTFESKPLDFFIFKKQALFELLHAYKTANILSSNNTMKDGK